MIGNRNPSLLFTIQSDITLRYHSQVNARHRKTLSSIFVKPTLASVVFADIEALIKALGGSVSERAGSHASRLNLRATSGAVIGRTLEKKQSDIRSKKLESFLNVLE